MTSARRTSTGSAARLERIAAELRPIAIAFVGKEAYRGPFGERPEHGLQERRLGGHVPLRAPVDVAGERGRALRGAAALVPRAPAAPAVKPWRDGVRALVLDPADRVLLVRFSFPPYPWAPPGGGLDPGESDEHALRRELAEELGLDEFELGPLLWTREHEFDHPVRFRGQRERCYLVRVEPVRAGPAARPGRRARERAQVVDAATSSRRSADVFGPRRLPALVRDLLDHGPPVEPPALGV